MSCIGVTVSPAVVAFYTLGVFMRVLTGEFDWSRAQVSGAITIGTLMIAVCTPYAGRLIDRIGVRPIFIVYH